MNMSKGVVFNKISEVYATGYRQRHPCLCGPSSIALAAYGLDLPLKSENEFTDLRFSRWVPTQEFVDRGMALHEAQFLAEMLYGGELEVCLRRAYSENRAALHEDLAHADRGQVALVFNFTQDTLLDRPFEGHGNPHYSVLCAHDKATETVWIADVDPEITAPYPVSEARLFSAMAIMNPKVGLPRGWLTLRRRRTCVRIASEAAS